MLTALLLAVALVPQTPTAARDAAPPPKAPVITVQAIAQVTVPAEQAILTLGVSAHESTAVAASQASAKKLRAVLDTLGALGFSADSLPTSEYILRRPESWDDVGDSLTGYIANNSITVAVRDLPRVGAVLDAAVARGANMVQDIQFTVNDKAAPRRLAIAKAMDDARLAGEQMAKSAGAQLGPLVSATTGTDPYSMMDAFDPSDPPLTQASRAAGFRPLGYTPITAPTVTVRAVVRVKWELTK